MSFEAKNGSAADRLTTAGIDVGSSAVKVAVLRSANESGTEVLALRGDRIRRRDLTRVIDETYSVALDEAGARSDDVAYVASTGEGELVSFRTGHFYGMTTHARGATFLEPGRVPSWTSGHCTLAPCASTSAARCSHIA